MRPFRIFIPGIAWFFLVLILICLPGNELPKADKWMAAIFFDKWIHAGLFGVLAFFFMRPLALSSLPMQKKLQAFIKIALSVSIWGLTCEYIQKYLIPGRTFDWGDWAADSVGALVALIIMGKKYFYKAKNKA